MNTDKMNYFLVTAKCLNISLAAQQLYISQPALSRQLRAIEQEWGVILFERTTKRMELTETGRMIYERLPGILQTYDDLLKEARDMHNQKNNRLDIAFLEGHGVPAALSSALNELSLYNSDIQVRIHRLSCKELEDAFRSGAVDLVYTVDFTLQNIPDAKYISFAVSDTYAALSRQYLKERDIPQRLWDLADETFIIISPKEYSIAADLTLAACQAAGFTPRIREARNFDELQLLVETGQGVGIVGDYSLLMGNPDIKMFSFEQLKRRNFVAAWLPHNSSKALKTLLDILEA